MGTTDGIGFHPGKQQRQEGVQRTDGGTSGVMDAAGKLVNEREDFIVVRNDLHRIVVVLEFRKQLECIGIKADQIVAIPVGLIRNTNTLTMTRAFKKYLSCTSGSFRKKEDIS